MEITKPNTKLPVKGIIPYPEPWCEQTSRNELGMIFARPPFSELTSEHGFTAMLQIPFSRLPAGNLTGPQVSNHKQDNEAFDFLRFKSLKEEEDKNMRYEYKEIRCIIDWSTNMSFALGSVVGYNAEPLEALNQEILTLGNFQIDEEKFLLGIKRVRFLIHGRPYIQNVNVAKYLFPGHQGVDIQMVLGREFLYSYPGLALEPTFRKGSIEYVPWNYEHYESRFNINKKGELMVYVCGHSGIPPLKDNEGCKDEIGAYGVFFGPKSAYNMSLPKKISGSPIQEAALMEGIIAVAYLVVNGGLIYATPTFTSVRIFTDSQLIVDLLNPGGKLAEYREKGWRNKQGGKLGFWEALEYWSDIAHPALESERVIWMKKDLFAFEKVEKKTRELQAARHLAQCGLRFGDLYLCEEDLGNAKTSNRYNKKEWEKSGLHDMLYINTPDISCTISMAVQKKTDFLNTQVQADAKTTQKRPGPPEAMIHPIAPDAAHMHIASFFHPGAVCKFEKFTSTLANSRILSAMQILETLDQSFVREVLRITKEGRGLQDTLEFFKEGSGEIYFFHRSSCTDHEGGTLEQQPHIDCSPQESNCCSEPCHSSGTSNTNLIDGDAEGTSSKESGSEVHTNCPGASSESFDNANPSGINTEETGSEGAGV